MLLQGPRLEAGKFGQRIIDRVLAGWEGGSR